MREPHRFHRFVSGLYPGMLLLQLLWVQGTLVALSQGTSRGRKNSLQMATARIATAHNPPPLPSLPPNPYPNCSSGGGARQEMYNVRVVDRDPMTDGAAFISHVNGSSAFNFNFATAWFPPPEGSSAADGLVVRVVECNPNHHSCPNATHREWSNAGAITVIPAGLPLDGPLTAKYINASAVTWAGAAAPPHANSSRWGAADPRIAYRPADKTYYLAWDNCTQNCYPHRNTMLSTTSDPFDPDGWTFHGPILPGVYTGGASLLFRDDSGGPPHYAFVSDSNTANVLLLAESSDGLHWSPPANPSRRVFMAGRPGCWDVNGVAAGPQPERLSSGDYLYVYNIDTGFPYHPNPLGRCAIGWAILDGADPTQIVARSTDALLRPTLPWEQCPGGKGRSCQEPMVVFTTGMKPLGGDEFYVLYGAADTDVGVARIKVDIRNVA